MTGEQLELFMERLPTDEEHCERAVLRVEILEALAERVAGVGAVVGRCLRACVEMVGLQKCAGAWGDERLVSASVCCLSEAQLKAARGRGGRCWRGWGRWWKASRRRSRSRAGTISCAKYTLCSRGPEWD
jgi:hypothetical protein